MSIMISISKICIKWSPACLIKRKLVTPNFSTNYNLWNPDHPEDENNKMWCEWDRNKRKANSQIACTHASMHKKGSLFVLHLTINYIYRIIHNYLCWICWMQYTMDLASTGLQQAAIIMLGRCDFAYKPISSVLSLTMDHFSYAWTKKFKYKLNRVNN